MHSKTRTESVNGEFADHPLSAALTDQLNFWPEPRTDIGTPEPGWITTATLLEDEAALDDMLEYQGSFNNGVDQKSRAAFLMSDYSFMFSITSVPLFTGFGLVPDFSAKNYALQFFSRSLEHDGETIEVRRANVRFLSFDFSTDRPNESTHPDAAALVDHAGLCACFQRGVEDHFLHLIERLHEKSGLSRNALWRLVGDALAARFLDAGRRFNCLEQAKASALTILKQPGSPLNNPQMHYFDVAVHDDKHPERVLRSHTFRARGGCCRHYLTEGGNLCSTCVLQDPAVRDRIIHDAMRRHLGLADRETETIVNQGKLG